MTRVLNKYIEKVELAKKAKVETTGDDMREGLACFSRLKVPSRSFPRRPRRARVLRGASGGRGIGRRAPAGIPRRAPRDARLITSKSFDAARARERAQGARDDAQERLWTGWACPASSPTARSAIRRCASCTWWRRFRRRLGQAGPRSQVPGDLPLKGKILNVERARFDKLLSSAEIATLITAPLRHRKERIHADKLRYTASSSMTDADVDGSHIRTLLLTFFYRQMPELVERATSTSPSRRSSGELARKSATSRRARAERVHAEAGPGPTPCCSRAPA